MRGYEALSPHSAGVRKAWSYLSLPGRSDRPSAEVVPLSGHDSAAQFEDELPVKQLVTLVGVLDDVRQLADV